MLQNWDAMESSTPGRNNKEQPMMLEYHSLPPTSLPEDARKLLSDL
jgi:hypothetical protein